MLTADGLSGSGSATQIAISLGIVVVLYSTIGIIAIVLMVRHARRGLQDEPTQSTDDTDQSGPTLATLTY
jgi:cytochrome d ubiquinol oxidase subunit I